MRVTNMIESIYDLSPMQAGILFHSLEESEGLYHEQTIITINSKIDREVFAKSFQEIINQYDVLRTVFTYTWFERPMQVVLKERKQNIYYYDLSDMDITLALSEVELLCQKDLKLKFDLKKDVLIRATVIKLEEEKFIIIWSYHHIILDGWCNLLIFKNFVKIYHTIELNNKNYAEKQCYREYIDWIQQQDQKAALDYWNNYLSGYKGVIQLPYDEKQSGYQKEELDYELDLETQEIMEDIAKANCVTISMVFQLIWGIVLLKYFNCDDVVFGLVISGRNPRVKDIDTLVGLFINTVPLRLKYNALSTIKTMLEDLNNSFQKANEYDFCSLADIQSNSQIKGALFDNIFIMENFPSIAEMSEEDSLMRQFNIVEMESREKTNYDLNFVIYSGDRYKIKYSYNGNKYTKHMVERMFQSFLEIARFLKNNLDCYIKDISVISEKDRVQLQLFNQNNKNIPQFTLNKLLLDAAYEYKQKNAVVTNNKTITYEELDRESSHIAAVLQKRKIGKGDVVAVVMENSIEFIKCIWAVLKCNAAYLPINPLYPKDRIEFILRNSETLIAIVKDEKVDYNSCSVLNYSKMEVEKAVYAPMPVDSDTSSLAYIIYTSGTTGCPKGVMIEHKSIAKTLLWRRDEYEMSSDSNIMPLVNGAFDGFITSCFTGLISGATICLLSEQEQKDLHLTLSLIKKFHISDLICVPSFYSLIIEEASIDDITDLKRITLAGEELKKEVVIRSKQKNTDAIIFNEYGPTENSVITTLKKDVKVNEKITLGSPKAGCQVYILDRHGNIQPIGVNGEICITGDGLARGYINNRQLTEEKFINSDCLGGIRLYKTGDIGRWNYWGELEFVGRLDNQVKVRGIRIELEEIERILCQFNDITEAAVMVIEEKEEKRLAGYYKADRIIARNEIRNYLFSKMPYNMVPDFLLQIDTMPRTLNGKIDKSMLPQNFTGLKKNVESNEIVSSYENILIEIWKMCFKCDSITVQDNFFELGGNSIKAIQIVSKLALKGIHLKVNDIFYYQTIRSIADNISSINNKKKEIQTFDGVSKNIKENLGISSRLINVWHNDRNIHVLLVKDNSHHIQLEKYIECNVIYDFEPNYIIESDVLDLSEDQISKILYNKSKTYNVKDLSIFEKTIDKAIKYNYLSVKAGNIANRIPFTGGQYLRFEYIEPTGTIISFNEYIDINKLNKAVMEVIKSNFLLHSTMKKKETWFDWEEHIIINDFILPIIDLSIYCEKAKKKYLSRIAAIYIYKKYEFNSELLHRMILVKSDNKTYYLILAFSHMIFDGISSEVIKRQIMDYYYLNLTEAETRKLDYVEYVRQINLGPTISEQKLNQLYKLNDYSKALDEMGKSFKEIQLKKINTFDKNNYIVLTLPINEFNSRNQNPLQISLTLFKHILKECIPNKEIPILMVNYGRNYNSHNFFGIIGECIDYIPVLLDFSEKTKNSEDILTKISRLLGMTDEYNINFSNLFMNSKSSEKYNSIAKKITKNKIKNAILFNFQEEFGGTNNEYEEILKNEDEYTRFKENYPLYYFMTRKVGNELKVYINLPFIYKCDLKLVLRNCKENEV